MQKELLISLRSRQAAWPYAFDVQPGRLCRHTHSFDGSIVQRSITHDAAPADVAALITWFVLTGRKDLAPPPEQ